MTKDGEIQQPDELQFLKGIGPKRALALAAEGIDSLRNLLLYTPRRYLDRRTVTTLHRLKMELLSAEGTTAEVTVIVTLQRMNLPVSQRGRKRLVMRVADGTAEADLVFFHGTSFFTRLYKPGDSFAVSGPPEVFGGGLQWTHPEIEPINESDSELLHSGRIVPVYPEPKGLKGVGLGSRALRKIIEPLFRSHGPTVLGASLPDSIRERYGYPSLYDAVRSLHFPESDEELEAAGTRMKYEELLHVQIGLALRKRHRRTELQARDIVDQSRRATSLRASLPFELTGAQDRVLADILTDVRSPSPMNRLLQGDVGSGKTIVALLALLHIVDSGMQGAFMAPTEILAEQHARTLEKLLEGSGVRTEILVGGLNKKARNELLEELKTGQIDILVGTHALFQKGVDFADLGLVVIDEQHRFGVRQRAELIRKGRSVPDTLIMSATPIPRTLTMNLYGDLDVSIIDELPANRKPIKTAVRFESEIEKVWQFVRAEVGEGRQAYVVYPLVEESEALDVKSAVERHELHQNVTFPGLRVGLIHGQMLWYEKEDVMASFLAKELDILVSTTVIEVGIDVPNASIMVIENAERFGLSQLHQLRGRVGRGDKPSSCLLMYKGPLSVNGKARLEIMRQSEDGFLIAEKDWELRGSGDLLGAKQSGLPNYKLADLDKHKSLLETAVQDARLLAQMDPGLTSQRGEAAKNLLYLFEQDFGIALMKAG